MCSNALAALILFFSKSLLRHPLARSSIEEFTGDSHFQWIIPDPAHTEGEHQIQPKEEIERVILCTGQVYAALHKYRQQNGITNTAITRIETLLNETENHNRRHVLYAGRNPSASVATGLKSSHMKEEQDLLETAFNVKQDKLKGE